MSFGLSKNELAEAIADAHDGKEPLHLTVGLFFAAFGAAELQMTRVLAHVIDMQNFEQFDFLAKTMDVRTKYERLKNAAKLYAPMGENIESRLDIFTVRIRRVRNNLAHSELTLHSGKIVCSSMSAFRVGIPDNVRPKGQAPVSYTIDEIQRLSLWLYDFHEDLSECAELTWGSKKNFEIAHPRSELP